MLALWVTNRERHRRFIDAELLPAWGLRHVASWYWLKVTDDGQLVSPLVRLPASNHCCRGPPEWTTVYCVASVCVTVYCFAKFPVLDDEAAFHSDYQLECGVVKTWEHGMQEAAYRRPYEALLLCQPISSAGQVAAASDSGAADSSRCGEQEHNVIYLQPEISASSTVQKEASDMIQSSRTGHQGSQQLRDMVIIAVPGQHSRKPHVGRLLAPHLPPSPQCLEVGLGTP